MKDNRAYLEWLQDLFMTHNVTLRKVARYNLSLYLGNTVDAEDVLQDVFLIAARKDLRAMENPVAWLIKTIVLTCRNKQRSIRGSIAKQEMITEQYRQSWNTQNNTANEPAVPDESGQVIIDLTLQQELPPDEYRLWQARFVEHQSVEEICKREGINQGTARMRIFRLQKKVQKILSMIVVIIFLFQYM